MRAAPPLLLTLALAAGAARADSISCDRGIVSTGDSKLDLLAKCGAPALMEASQVERSVAQVSPDGRFVGAQRVVVTVERWTYNFGPQRFLQFVTLEMGKVVAVERGSYGYELPREAAPAGALRLARCDQQAFHLGDSTFDVLARCGEPALKEVKQVTGGGGTRLPDGTLVGGSASAQVEVWTLNFGPHVFIRHLEFQGGTLVRIETGGYGYEPPAGQR